MDKVIWKSKEEWLYFLGNVLIEVKSYILLDCLLVLSLLKHKEIGAFLNQKNEDSK